MRLIVSVTLALCLAFLFVQVNADCQLSDLMSHFGGQDAIMKGMSAVTNMGAKMSEAFESLIRNGKSIGEAVPELVKMVPGMMQGQN